MSRLQKIKDWRDRRISLPAQQFIAKWGRRLLIGGVFLFLLKQLYETGWQDILANLPTHPLFYILFLFIYLGLPVAETFIYRLIWALPFRASFPLLLKKRVYNKDVLNYSGEAHLYMWARKHVDRSDKLLLRDMKDNTIISSLTSTLVAAALLGTFLFTGLLPLEVLVGEINTWWIVGGVFCLILLGALGYRFRKSVIGLPRKAALMLFGIHLGRLLFVQAVQVAQWMVVMSEVPVKAWFTLLSLQIVVNQLPLIPAKDLVVLGASADLSRWVRISESGVVGMLLVSVVLDKVINLILFSYLSWRDATGKTDTIAELPDGDALSLENNQEASSL